MSPTEIGSMVRNLVSAIEHGASDEAVGEGVLQIIEAGMDAVIEKQLTSPSSEDAVKAISGSPWGKRLFD